MPFGLEFILYIFSSSLSECGRRRCSLPSRFKSWRPDYSYQWRASAWPCSYRSHWIVVKGNSWTAGIKKWLLFLPSMVGLCLFSWDWLLDFIVRSTNSKLLLTPIWRRANDLHISWCDFSFSAIVWHWCRRSWSKFEQWHKDVSVSQKSWPFQAMFSNAYFFIR